MPLMRYVGPLDEAMVVIAGENYGIIKKGESLAVPDKVADGASWSEHWEMVGKPDESVKNDDDESADNDDNDENKDGE